jgi:hypothetical protein
LDLSKLKLGIYDVLGLILPGLFAIFEVWVLLRGWSSFLLALTKLNFTVFTVLLIFAFGLGNLVQELGQVCITAWKGERYFKRARDKFWKSGEAIGLKAKIKADLGYELTTADAAFDFCLTKLRGHFDKRDIFVATSDLSRSLVILFMLTFVPMARFAWELYSPTVHYFEVLGGFVLLLIFLAWLSWKRMLRFRELSEITVFRAYLATVTAAESRDEWPPSANGR